MALSNKAKLGIAAVAAGGLFLFMRDANAADGPDETESKASNMGDVAGCAAGTADAKANRAKADMDKQASLASTAFIASGLASSDMSAFAVAFTAAYERCYNENKVTGGGGGGGGGGGSGTIIFNPAKATNPVAAHGEAVAIGKAKAGAGVPASVIASDGTYKTLYAYSQYDAGASYLLTQLQTHSGITPDGKYGLQTQKAFDYFYYHTGL